MNGSAIYEWRVLRDTFPPTFRKIDVIYPSTLTADAMGASLDTAIDLHDVHGFAKIIICRATTETGYAGETFCFDWLGRRGLTERDVLFVDVPGRLNTLTEAKQVVEVLADMGCMNILLVSAVFHLPRCVQTFLSVAWQRNLWARFNIYTEVAKMPPGGWINEVAHSQGTTRGTPLSLICGERDRMVRYQNPEESQLALLSPEFCLQYFIERDMRDQKYP